ncbi:NAD(P)H-dependent oxidoreductase [Pantoea sp.]|uniref:NAD(P)H-dependent oxidoreductase n=1 Tax=Pantoea sp. TaxID=69393 RepID=UPI0031CE7B53
MHTLIVTAHPSDNAYTQAVVNRLTAGLTAAPGNSVEVADLAREQFDPRFTPQDYAYFSGSGAPDPAIVAEQQRIDRADRLVLVFPIYWWSMPALLKGWIDRVFTGGWAFDYDSTGLKKRLTRLEAMIVGIAGAPQETYVRRGYRDAIQTQIVEGIFDYCGIRALDSVLLHPLDAESQQQGLTQAFALGQALGAQSVKA